MPHTYAFKPPVRGKQGGPLLRLHDSLHDPLLEKTLVSTRLNAPLTPYRKSPEVENLLDDLTFKIPSKDLSLEQSVVLLTCGLLLRSREAALKERDKKPPAGVVFELSPKHVHNTDDPMSPDVLIGHSARENREHVVKIAVTDELSLLAVTLLRELGYESYLSTVTTPDGVRVSGLSIIQNEVEVSNFVIHGNHPSIAELTIFEDPEVLKFLTLLRANNNVKRLISDLRVGFGTPEETRERLLRLLAPERYNRAFVDFAVGSVSGHHLTTFVEDALVQLAKIFPELTAVPKEQMC